MVMKNWLLFVVIIAGSISISFASIFIKLCGEVSSIVIAAYRTGLVSLSLLPFFLFKKKHLDKRAIVLTLISSFFLALHFAFWISSLKYTSISSSLFILSIYPFFTAVLSRVVLKEKVPDKFFIGFLFSILGIALIFTFDLSSLKLTYGNILSFLGGVFLSFYYIPSRVVRKRVDIVDFTFIVYGGAAVFLILTALIFGEKIYGFSYRSYKYLLLLAIISQGIGHSSFNWALRYIRAGLVSLTTLIEPVGATILAFFIFKEDITFFKFIGMLLVSFGILIVWVEKIGRRGRKKFHE